MHRYWLKWVWISIATISKSNHQIYAIRTLAGPNVRVNDLVVSCTSATLPEIVTAILL